MRDGAILISGGPRTSPWFDVLMTAGREALPGGVPLVGQEAHDQRPARWLLSPGTRVIATIATVFLALFTFAAGYWRSYDLALVVPWCVIGFATHMLYVLMARGYVQADEYGVDARNILLCYRFTWAQIAWFDPQMNVVVVTHDGSRTTLWAVQRARIAAATGRRSRVDAVVEELERRRVHRFRALAAQEAPDPSPPRPRLVRLAPGEIVQLLTVMPGSVLVGVLLASV
ncbi:hypothetical protein ACFWH7_08925 [Cellulosimicrobium cellulans]|uniref:hypothetical protein n=1 Tax=Cellulosimicrobium cellulans TaxID=1710 RepID=UPI003648BEC8